MLPACCCCCYFLFLFGNASLIWQRRQQQQPQLEIPAGQCNANKLAFDLNLNGNRAPRPKAMQKIHLAYKPTHSGLNIAIGNFELTQVN